MRRSTSACAVKPFPAGPHPRPTISPAYASRAGRDRVCLPTPSTCPNPRRSISIWLADPGGVSSRLRAAGCVLAEEEAALLLAAASTIHELEHLISQRVAGHPLEHLVGWAAFDGLRIAVGPGVFVPRRRTEFLVQLAAVLAPPEATVLDLCCGSGALGAALLARRPDVRVTASDIDPVAAEFARRNLPPTSPLHVGDLFDPLPGTLRGRIGLVLANTPYVPSAAIALMPGEARLHEPRTALDGGTDGLALQRRVAAEVRGWLAPGGHVLVEVSEDQAPVTVGLFCTGGLRAAIRESSDDATVVCGTAPPD